MKRILIVDDNPDNQEQFLRLLEDTQRHITVVCDITKAIGTFDVLLIDISSVCPPRTSQFSMLYTSDAYQPICAFLEKHPGCTVIIHTALSRNTAESIAEEVIERCPDAVVKVANVMDWAETERMIDTC